VREELLEDNPAKKVLRPKGRSRSVEAVISGGDHEKLLGGAHPTLVPVIRLLYETGCRPGEIGKMTVENYHPDAAVFRLTEHKADKTGKVRNVFLPPDLNEFVKEVAAKRKSGVMFLTKRKTAWRAGAITLAMDRLRKKVGVSAVAYGYRHGFAHRALSGGESDSVVAALMGHSDTKMIHLHYSHLNENAVAMRAAVTRLSKTAGKCE
jgi:integrase